MVTVMNLELEQLKNYNLLARSTYNNACVRTSSISFIARGKRTARSKGNSRRLHAGYTATTSGQH